MNKVEAAMLLELITLSYPNAYRGMEDSWKKATINMWHMSFPDVPFPIMEQAFNHFRMVSKFPPTVAEMVEALRQVYFRATEIALVARNTDNMELLDHYKLVMAYTERFKDSGNLGWSLGSIQGRIGGENDAQRIGASGNRMGREDRIPVLDAGRRGPQ